MVTDRETLLEFYKVAHSEKLFTSRSMVERAGLFLVLNSGMLSFLASSLDALPRPFVYGAFAALAVVDSLWFCINERNRSYTKYCVDHLARIEADLVEDGADLDAPRIFHNMRAFARGESLRLFKKSDCRGETRMSWLGHLVKIEVAFSTLAVIFAVLNVALLVWVALTPAAGGAVAAR